MFYGSLNKKSTYQHLRQHPVWSTVFSWLDNLPKHLSEGEQNIQDKDIYAKIMSVETKLRKECVFESHRQYIDLHLCLSGSEIISWVDANQLSVKKPYDAEKDFLFHNSPKASQDLAITPQKFAIFFPGEAHMPMISDGKNDQIKKVVIKIRADLINL